MLFFALNDWCILFQIVINIKGNKALLPVSLSLSRSLSLSLPLFVYMWHAIPLQYLWRMIQFFHFYLFLVFSIVQKLKATPFYVLFSNHVQSNESNTLGIVPSSQIRERSPFLLFILSLNPSARSTLVVVPSGPKESIALYQIKNEFVGIIRLQNMTSWQHVAATCCHSCRCFLSLTLMLLLSKAFNDFR